MPPKKGSSKPQGRQFNSGTKNPRGASKPPPKTLNTEDATTMDIDPISTQPGTLRPEGRQFGSDTRSLGAALPQLKTSKNKDGTAMDVDPISPQPGTLRPEGRQFDSDTRSLGAALPQLKTSKNKDDTAMDVDPAYLNGVDLAINQAEDDIALDSDHEVPLDPQVPSEPAQPLSGNFGLLAALDEIKTGAPVSRTDTKSRGIHAEIMEKLRASKEAKEAAKKVEAATALADTQRGSASAESSKRPRSVTSPIESNKKSMNPWGQANLNPTDKPLKVDQLAKPKVDFESMIENIRLLPCAIRVNREKTVIGNPTRLGSSPGLSIRLRLDAGKLATPSIGLDFRISKSGKDSANPDDYHTFSVGWEPGVEIEGKFMMEDLKFHAAVDEVIQPLGFPEEIRKLVYTDQEKSKLVCATFTSNAHKATVYDPMWPAFLPAPTHENVLRHLDDLTEESGSYQVTIWFMVPTMSIDYFRQGCLSHLEYAVQEHLRPHHIYRDEHGEPLINYQMPSIKAIGDGMYVRYPIVSKPDGTKVPDKDAVPRLINLPKKKTWESIKGLYVYYGVSSVREHQFNLGLHAPLMKDWHRVYLEKIPVWSVDGKSLTPGGSLFRTSYYAGVRMKRNKDGAKDSVPPVDSIIKMDFYNGVNDPIEGKREHRVIDSECWYGRVMTRPVEWLKQTGTDFCVLVTKKRRGMQKTCFGKDERELKADETLPRARIEVKIDPTAATRELKALAKFCNPGFEPELLDQIRLALASNPSQATPVTYADLTWGPKYAKSQENHDKWQAMMKEHALQRKDNPSQMEVLNSASKMRSNIVAVADPPGAGKTKTLVDKCIALLKINHKVLCVAAANVAVDTDANALWKALTPEERKQYKCLRLEGRAAERAAILAKVSYDAYGNKEGEADELPEYAEDKKVGDDPLIRNTLEKLASDYAARENQMKPLMAKYKNVADVYAALEEDPSFKSSNVFLGMALDYRIWELTQEDKLEAARLYAEARAELSDKDFDDQFAAGKVSQDQFDKSFLYRASNAHYVRNSGKITGKERKQFEEESDRMIKRVLADTNILFVTCSNAGGTLLEDGKNFNPSVIVADETGQIGLARLCVPLTTFTDWEGLFLFGDVCQLEPTVLSGQFNEFILNARISPLALLFMKQFPRLLLDTQYRMCPAISAFPNQQFYHGELKNHPSALKDNETRAKMRKLSLDQGIKGFKNKGYEYFLIDVENGVSRVEVNGTSLVNHANADCIIKNIEAMILLKIEAAEINILTYYQGQRRLIQRKIQETNWTAETKQGIQVHTVYSFLGKESSVVILDMVTAKDPLMFRELKGGQPKSVEADDELDNGSEGYIKLGAITGHVRNPNRLNVALTRARNGLVVVCQQALLVGHPNRTKNRGKAFNSISLMCANAKARGCLVSNSKMEDSHPQSVELRKMYGEEDVKVIREKQRKIDRGFINELIDVARSLRGQARRPAADIPRYRTAKGHTTRPIEESPAVIAAEAHDKEQERLAEEARQLEKGTQLSLASAVDEDQLHQAMAMSDSQMDEEYPVLPSSSQKGRHDDMNLDPNARSANAEQDDDSDDEFFYG